MMIRASKSGRRILTSSHEAFSASVPLRNAKESSYAALDDARNSFLGDAH